MTKRQAKVQLTSENPEAESDASDHETVPTIKDKSQRVFVNPVRPSTVLKGGSNPFKDLDLLKSDKSVGLMKSLNSSFLKAIQDSLLKNPSVDLQATLFPQYIKHLENVRSGTLSCIQSSKPDNQKPIINSTESKSSALDLTSVPSSLQTMASTTFQGISPQPTVREPDSFTLSLSGNDSLSNVFKSNFNSNGVRVESDEAVQKNASLSATVSSIKETQEQLQFTSSLHNLEAKSVHSDIKLGDNVDSNSVLKSIEPSQGLLKNDKVQHKDKGTEQFQISDANIPTSNLFSPVVFSESSIFSKQPSFHSFPKPPSDELKPFSFLSKENTELKGVGFVQFDSNKTQQNEARSASENEEEESEPALRKPDEDPLLKTGEGEENEECLCEERSKLYVKNEEKGWTELGIGITKINKNNQNQKKRVLFRVEGSGKALLNCWIQAAAANAKGKDMFLAVSQSDSNRPIQYLLRYTSPEKASFVCDFFKN